MNLFNPNRGNVLGTELKGGNNNKNFLAQNYNKASAEEILDTVLYHLEYMISNNIAGFYILEQLKALEDAGYIEFAGDGSNRRFFKVNADMRNVLNRKGFFNSGASVVCGIPINFVNGTKDNRREILAPEYMKFVIASPNPDENAQYLQAIIPEAVAYDTNANIIIQEEVTPIEKSEVVLDLYNNNPEKYKGNIGSAVLDAFYTHPELMAQLDKLMTAMDQYFVMCDLNIVFSRFNFGFKRLNGIDYLTVLDLGGVLPRVAENAMPKCKSCNYKLSYVNIGEPFYNEDKGRRERLYMGLSTTGLYTCKNPYCHGEGSDPEVIDDMKVFEEYRKNLIRMVSTGEINLNGWDTFRLAL